MFNRLIGENPLALIRTWRDMWNNELRMKLPGNLIAGRGISLQKMPSGTVISAIPAYNSGKSGTTGFSGNFAVSEYGFQNNQLTLHFCSSTHLVKHILIANGRVSWSYHNIDVESVAINVSESGFIGFEVEPASIGMCPTVTWGVLSHTHGAYDKDFVVIGEIVFSGGNCTYRPLDVGIPDLIFGPDYSPSPSPSPSPSLSPSPSASPSSSPSPGPGPGPGPSPSPSVSPSPSLSPSPSASPSPSLSPSPSVSPSPSLSPSPSVSPSPVPIWIDPVSEDIYFTLHYQQILKTTGAVDHDITGEGALSGSISGTVSFGNTDIDYYDNGQRLMFPTTFSGQIGDPWLLSTGITPNVELTQNVTVFSGADFDYVLRPNDETVVTEDETYRRTWVLTFRAVSKSS